MSAARTAPPPAFFSRQVLDARRFYLDLRPPSAASLTVVGGGWESCAPDYSIDRTSFPFFGLEFVAGGQGELRLGGRRYRLALGSVFVYGGGVAHRITTDPTNRLSKYFVDFAGRRAPALLRESGLSPGSFRTVTLHADVQKAFEDLLRAGQRTQDAKRLGALHLEILLLIIAGSSGPAAVRSQRAFLTFTRCRQHLEEHFLRIKTAEEAARECHVDAAYLCRLYARFARQSPYGFLQRLQMNHAAALLEGGQHLVREVADVFGMDPFHFSRTFKRVHGVPPSIFVEERLRPSEKHRSRSESAR